MRLLKFDVPNDCETQFFRKIEESKLIFDFEKTILSTFNSIPGCKSITIPTETIIQVRYNYFIFQEISKDNQKILQKQISTQTGIRNILQSVGISDDKSEYLMCVTQQLQWSFSYSEHFLTIMSNYDRKNTDEFRTELKLIKILYSLVY